ncbi:MAG: AAA family ATPase [Streptosporangiaceae bacterium]
MDEIQAHLPEEPNSFVGRERELGELSQLLGRTRLLTLSGPGGIGKTRLALRVLAAASEGFPDGAWFVELADLGQPDLVASRIAAVLGVSEEAGRPLLDTLAEALRPRRLLLGLDNCEHLIEACAQVSRELLARAPGLRLLATSREPLSVAAETIWRVPPLSVAPAGTGPAGNTEPAGNTGAAEGTGPAGGDATRYEAVRLFAERAAASWPGFAVGPGNAAAVASICRALDGMPLAIELAAAWVRALPVDQIRARLDDRFGLLTTGDRAAAPRQRTLRAAIEWSYDLLTEPE